MAFVVELLRTHFEPLTIDVVQGSIGPAITFVYPDYVVTNTSPYIYLEDPNGVVTRKSCTPHADLTAAVFTPAVDTFLIPGLYKATMLFSDANVDSFSFRFRVYENPRYVRWTRTFPDTVMASGTSETISTSVGAYALTALGNTIIVKAGGEVYLLPDHGSVSVYGTNVVVAYDSDNNLITITNTAGDATIPQIDFVAYDEAPIGVKMVYPTPLPIWV